MPNVTNTIGIGIKIQLHTISLHWRLVFLLFHNFCTTHSSFGSSIHIRLMRLLLIVHLVLWKVHFVGHAVLLSLALACDDTGKTGVEGMVLSGVFIHRGKNWMVLWRRYLIVPQGRNYVHEYLYYIELVQQKSCWYKASHSRWLGCAWCALGNQRSVPQWSFYCPWSRWGCAIRDSGDAQARLYL